MQQMLANKFLIEVLAISKLNGDFCCFLDTNKTKRIKLANTAKGEEKSKWQNQGVVENLSN